MECNCINNHNGTSLVTPEIKHVQGNVLRLAIPLTLRTVEMEGGEMVYTDTDFIPSSDAPVKVVFSKGAFKMPITATMKNGNVAFVEEKGKIPVGVYDITVTCNDEDGNPYRFKQNTVLQVVDATAEAGIVTPIEYEVETWYLDSAIYLALEGRGIEDIITESSGEIGGFNYVTIILTDGTSRTFSIMNGSGSVDSELNINSPSPIANRAVTEKFVEVEGNMESLFGDVDYDATSNKIRFFAKGKPKTSENILATLDARPFTYDDFLQNVSLSGGFLVLKTKSSTFSVNTNAIFNPNSYYNKTQVDNRILEGVRSGLSGKADLINGRVPFDEATPIVLASLNGDNTVLSSYNEGDYFAVVDTEKIYQVVNGFADEVGEIDDKLIYCDKSDDTLYRWNGSEFAQVGGNSGSGGITATYSNGTITITSGGSSQPVYSNGTITF